MSQRSSTRHMLLASMNFSYQPSTIYRLMPQSNMKTLKPPLRVDLRLGGYIHGSTHFGHFQKKPRVIVRKRTRSLVNYLIDGRFKVAHEDEPPCCDRSNMGARIYWIIIRSFGGFQPNGFSLHTLLARLYMPCSS